MTLKRVEENPSYMKDPATGNIINSDGRAYHARRKKMAVERKRKVEVDELKSQVAELQSLVKQLIDEK